MAKLGRERGGQTDTIENGHVAILKQIAVVDNMLGRLDDALATSQKLLPKAGRVFGETVPSGSVCTGYARVGTPSEGVVRERP